MTPENHMMIASVGAVVMLMLMSAGTIGVWYPWAVLKSDSMIMRIIGWFFVIQCVGGLLSVAVIKGMLSQKVCPICEKKLTTFMAVYGSPKGCNTCGTVFHSKCLRGVGACPICYPRQQAPVEMDFSKRF